ncbi:hypothetical protein F4810DRAFT_710959 [Camillea tinctor]|nr:hypothetical protein F4810DRAFT_710959 [Camillea tinctor]
MKHAILAALLGLNPQVLGLRGPPSSSTPTLHSDFVRADSTVSSFTSPFTPAENQTFVCQVDSIEPVIQHTEYSDCQALMDQLLDYPGFWACSGWEKGKYYTLVEHGTCSFRVARADGVDLAVIGNGDVYATLMLALDTATQNGTIDYLGFYGTDVCGPAPSAARIDFAI